MNHPNELSYSKSHEWVKMDGDTAICLLYTSPSPRDS